MCVCVYVCVCIYVHSLIGAYTALDMCVCVGVLSEFQFETEINAKSKRERIVVKKTVLRLYSKLGAPIFPEK